MDATFKHSNHFEMFCHNDAKQSTSGISIIIVMICRSRVAYFSSLNDSCSTTRRSFHVNKKKIDKKAYLEIALKFYKKKNSRQSFQSYLLYYRRINVNTNMQTLNKKVYKNIASYMFKMNLH